MRAPETDFERQLPGTFNFGRDVVDAIARADPGKLALIWCDQSGREQRFSFGEISQRSSQLAARLAAEGVQRGERVLVMLPRLPQWQIAMVGCLKPGAVPIPCIEMLTGKDVQYRVQKAQAVGAITTTRNIGKFGDVPGLRVRLAVGGGPGWQDFDEALDAQPANFDCADTGWSKAGTSILFGPWSQGAAVLFYDRSFDAAERLRLIAPHGVSVFCGAATEFRHLVNEDFRGVDLGRLRLRIRS